MPAAVSLCSQGLDIGDSKLCAGRLLSLWPSKVKQSNVAWWHARVTLVLVSPKSSAPTSSKQQPKFARSKARGGWVV